MYAVIRDNTFDVLKLAAGAVQIADFQAAHAGQPGYVGGAVVDAGSGRQVSITLWRSEEEADAARQTLGPVIGRTLQPMMATPSKLVATGQVVFNDLAPTR
jgi:hypothetical protein